MSVNAQSLMAYALCYSVPLVETSISRYVPYTSPQCRYVPQDLQYIMYTSISSLIISPLRVL